MPPFRQEQEKHSTPQKHKTSYKNKNTIRQAPKIARIKVLSRKAENQSYQATIQTDCQNEPNSCKIQRPVPRLLKCHHCTCLCTSIFFGRHTGRKGTNGWERFQRKSFLFLMFSMFRKTVESINHRQRGNFSRSTLRELG
jgi:hypothetical protein